MKKIILTLSSIFLLVLHFATAQEHTIETAIENYQSYFKAKEDQEIIYTTTNKDKYFAGESIWFASYINKANSMTPNISTTNVKVGLFDSDGILKKQKTLFTQNAKTHGHFKIDSTFNNGIYYLKTTTNYMRNFDDDFSSVKKIIIGDLDIVNNNTNNNVVQFSFEGGNYIENTTNTIGFTIPFYNHSNFKVKAIQLKNNLGETVLHINNYIDNLGSFKLTPEENKTYTLNISYTNGEQLNATLPTPKKTGLNLTINTDFENKFFAALNTNALTLTAITGKQYYLLIHQNGKLVNIPITLNSSETSKILSLTKDQLFNGINTATLLDENGNIISERIFFNSTKEEVAFQIAQQTTKDTTTVILTTNNIENLYNISVSVLPEATQTKVFKKNTIKNLYLKPYIKPTILENFSINTTSRKGLFALDMLLAFEGKSNYDWNLQPKPKANKLYAFESGFTIKGKLNNFEYNEENKLLLISKESELFLEIPLKKDNSFEISNVFVIDSADINFTFVNKRDKNKIPKVSYTITPVKNKLNTLDISKLNTKNITTIKTPESKEVTNSFIKDAIALEEVIVEENKRDEREKERRKHIMVSFTAKDVDLTRYPPTQTLLGLISSQNGYQVRYTFDGPVILQRSRTTSFRDNTYLGYTRPLIFVNDMPIEQDFSYQLESMLVQDLKAIYFSKINPLYGSRGAKGTIHIYQDFVALGKKYSKKIFKTMTATNGFAQQIPYQNPLYDNSDLSQYEKYGVLNWIPNVPVDENGTYKFNFQKYHNPVNLYIEGIDAEGNLISQIIKVDPNKNL